MKRILILLAALSISFSGATAKPVHLKVDGPGFFIMTDVEGDHFYTSDMNFYRNKDGEYVTFDRKHHLQGRAISSSGTVASSMSNINLTNISSAPEETHEVSVSANLDASSAIRTGSAANFDGTSALNAGFTSDFSVSIAVHDSLGNARTITIYFSHTGATRWDFHVLSSLENLDTQYSRGEGAFVIQEGSIIFGPAGRFEKLGDAVSKTPADQDGILTAGERIDSTVQKNIGMIPWGNGAQPVKVGGGWDTFRVDFGQQFYSETVMTGYASPSLVTSMTQDGSFPGTLQSINIDVNGVLSGAFTNGLSRDLYQIPIATFMGEDFLSEVSPGIYSATDDSGYPQIGQANTAGRGTVNWIKD